MRIVIDTNVILASLRSSSGASFAIVNLIEHRKVTPVVSVPLLFEYEEILHRPGSVPHLSARQIDDYLDYILSLSVEQKIFFLWRPMLADCDDDMLLELAVAAQADYLVTHNVSDFLPAAPGFGFQVVTPGQFLRAFRTGNQP
ncbi:MAG: putative toxin-antitoxin system toxin component, PIN family [Chthoniobacteraceae bacterium]|jgi:putative PIN family toxin of toxin-antitoxin system